MWDQQLFELFTNIIPQSFAFILLFFSLTNIKIKAKPYILISIGLSVLVFLIRPYVNFGVHSVIMLFSLVIIGVAWGKAEIVSSVIYGLITYMIAYISEWLTFIFLTIIGFDLDLLNSDSKLRTIIGVIPLLLFFGAGLTVYYVKKKQKKKEE